MSESCQSCRYFVVLEKPGHSFGECHRYPPVALNTFVGVNPDQWCGEWTKRSLKIVEKASKSKSVPDQLCDILEELKPHLAKGDDV